MSALQLITQSAPDQNQTLQADPTNQAPAGASSVAERKSDGVQAAQWAHPMSFSRLILCEWGL